MPSLRNTQPGSARNIRVRRDTRPVRRPDFTPVNKQEVDLRNEKVRNEFEGRVKHSPQDISLWLRYARFESTNNTGKTLGVLERASKAAPSREIDFELLKLRKDPQFAAQILEKYPNSDQIRTLCLPLLNTNDARTKLVQLSREDPKYYRELISLEKKCGNIETVCNLYNLWATQVETNADLWFDATEYVRTHGSKETWFSMCATAMNFLYFSKPKSVGIGRKFLVNNFLRYCQWTRKDQEGLVEQLLQLDLYPSEEALFIKHAHRCRMRDKDINPITACKNISKYLDQARVMVLNGEHLLSQFDRDALGFYFEDILAKPVPEFMSPEYNRSTRDLALYATGRQNERFFNRVVSLFGKSSDIVNAYARYHMRQSDEVGLSRLEEVFEKYGQQIDLSRLASCNQVIKSPSKYRDIFYNHLARTSTRVDSWTGVLRLEKLCRNIDACRQLYELAIEQIEVWDDADCEISGWEEIWMGYLSLERHSSTLSAYRDLLSRWAVFGQGKSKLFWEKALEELYYDHGTKGGELGLCVLDRLTDGEISQRKPGKFAKFLRPGLEIK